MGLRCRHRLRWPCASLVRLLIFPTNLNSQHVPPRAQAHPRTSYDGSSLPCGDTARFHWTQMRKYRLLIRHFESLKNCHFINCRSHA
ncbi:hypothetical protein B0H11DRAFT_1980699 [Mycena galericulata]|nr:hypothetical protein B0H11DRAFT_1980699 [Mycena galericulata]